MTVTINGSFYEKLDDKKVATAMNAGMNELALTLYRKCVEKSPYRTGKLQESHSTEVNTSNTELKSEAKIKNGAHYWSFVEFGTSKMSPRRWVAESLYETDVFGTFYNTYKAHYKTGR